MNNYKIFKKQLSQLCQTVLLFQSNIQPLRQMLFIKYNITDQIIWKIMFGNQIETIGKQQLNIFIKKCNNLVNKKNQNQINININDCEIIVRRYSGYRDERVNKEDLWQIFRPKTIAMTDNLIKMRKSKDIMPKLMAIDFRAKQLIFSILQKTIEYQILANKMRINIGQYSQQFEMFNLPKIQAKYLQIQLIQNLPQISIKQCQIILQHIVGKNKNKEKFFYTFFLPQVKKIVDKNPMQKIKIHQEQNHTTLQIYHKNKQIWHYGKNYEKHRKPLYLQ